MKKIAKIAAVSTLLAVCGIGCTHNSETPSASSASPSQPASDQKAKPSTSNAPSNTSSKPTTTDASSNPSTPEAKSDSQPESSGDKTTDSTNGGASHNGSDPVAPPVGGNDSAPQPAAPAPVQPAVPEAPQPPATNFYSAYGAEGVILSRLNAARANEGLAPLARLAHIDNVARGWASNMATTRDFRHNPDFFSQLNASYASENIAMVYGADGDALFQAWWNSPGHHKNMMTAEFRYIGIAVVCNESGECYGVQNFTN